MKIINNTATHHFNNLQLGDVFIYGTSVYLKTNTKDNVINCFNLNTNLSEQFNGFSLVTKVGATLIIGPLGKRLLKTNYISED